MNPVVLYFASGESLYPGAALLVSMVAASPFLRRTWFFRLRNLGVWVALVLIVMASPPFPWLVNVVLLAAFVAWFVAVNRREAKLGNARLRRGAAIVVAGVLLVFTTLELRHRQLPVIAGARSDRLVVIGDSISAGIDPRVPAWPTVFHQMTGVAVKNLARPGAQSNEGLSMAQGITPEDNLVLIELGGNDLLNGVPSHEFGRRLEALLEKLATPGRTVVMFELPRLPNSTGYGCVQRRLVAKYRVPLIPRRYFVDVLADADATLDGLHLSAHGTRRMADLAAKVLAPVLNSTAEPSQSHGQSSN